MEYKVLTYLNLPNDVGRKAPGDMVSSEELEAAGQTEDDIAALLDGGAISESSDAEVDPAHRDVDPNTPTVARMVSQARLMVDTFGDNLPDEIKNLAQLDYVDVNDSDSGRGESSAN